LQQAPPDSHDLPSACPFSDAQQALPDSHDLPSAGLFSEPQQAQSQVPHLQTPVSQQQVPSEQQPFCKQQDGHPQSFDTVTLSELTPANTNANPPTSINPAKPK
jgi:hypothetical protein